MTRTSRLVIALGVNVALVAGQLVAGLVAHSVGLLSDAGHNLADVAALGLSLWAVRWALRPRSAARSFGNHRAGILVGLASASALAIISVAIAAAGVERIMHPRPVSGGIVLVTAAVAVVANLAAALMLADRSRDLNMRSATLHMATDAASSLCVLVAGLLILLGGKVLWRADPIASFVVAAVIVVESWRLARESVGVLLESTPGDLDLAGLRRTITTVDGVGEVHDLHVWSLSSEVRALSAHLVLTGHPTLEEAQEVGARVRLAVMGPFELAHTTLELECERCLDHDDPCAMDEVATAFESARSLHDH
jgi:cobalt-zinc-cadmium efflux system protein